MTEPTFPKFYDVKIDSGDRSSVRIEVSGPDGDQFNPYQYLDIRKWFIPTSGAEKGQLMRTKKGVRIKLPQTIELCRVIIEAYNEATGSHFELVESDTKKSDG